MNNLLKPAKSNQRFRLFFWISLLLIALTACSYQLKQRDTYSHVINFNEVYEYAERAAYAYKSDEEIRLKYGIYSDISMGAGTRYKLKWFVQNEDYPSNKSWIVIRGTDNLKNVISDAEYVKKKDVLSNIWLHQGFKSATEEIYSDLKSHIDIKREIYISGHSLGGASAAIAMIWLKEEGYDVRFCYTFGQPKVTNKAGFNKYKDLNLVRIINEKDVVPYVPPATLISLQRGRYRHFGEEVILQQGTAYVYLEQHDASRTDVTSFWRNIDEFVITDHFIDNYLKNLEPKKHLIEERDFNDRAEQPTIPVNLTSKALWSTQ